MPTTMNSGFLTVELSLEGLPPGAFVLDTGAGSLAVSETIADQLLRLHPRRTAAWTDVRSGVEHQLGRALRIRSLEMGPVTMRNVRAVTFDSGDWGPTAQEKIQGLVGLTIFADYVVSIDLSSGDLAISKDASIPTPPDEARVPSRFSRGGVLEAEIEVGGHKRWTHVDTGSSLGFEIPSAMDPLTTGVWQQYGEVHSVDGSRSYSKTDLAAEVRIGDTSWIDCPAVSTQDAILSVGMGVLSNYRLTYDGPGNQLWLEGPAEPGDPPIRCQADE